MRGMLALVGLLVLIAACADASNYSLALDLPDEARADATRIEVYIAESCAEWDSTVQARFLLAYMDGVVALDAMDRSLPPGDLAIHVRALDGRCRILAEGCSPASIRSGRSTEIEVTLDATSRECSAPSTCDCALDAGSDADAAADGDGQDGDTPDADAPDVGADVRDASEDVPVDAGLDASVLVSLDIGDSVRVDLGPRVSPDWPPLPTVMSGVGPVASVAGAETSIQFAARTFSGFQEGGRGDNTLGWPANVSLDTLWVGSFTDHATALGLRASVEVTGLAPGRYSFVLFASRTENDSGRGRLTRYRVGAETFDLEVSDNVGEVVTFVDVAPDPSGRVEVTITVSPDGTARFGYLGAMTITRTE